MKNLLEPRITDNMDNDIIWHEGETVHRARWHSEAQLPPPKRVVVADDTMSADQAYRYACEGTALLWRGDFQNARQLTQALARRVDQTAGKGAADAGKAAGGKGRGGMPRGMRDMRREQQLPTQSAADAFHRYRMGQAQRARVLGMVLIPFEADHTIPLRRAPDVKTACSQAYGVAPGQYVASLRELLGVIGAHEWRRKGLEIAALGTGNRIHAHYGVFAPVRGEYLALVAEAPLPLAGSVALAFDIGTGTGVLAAMLARRGVAHVVATDNEARALACARDNLKRLGLAGKVEVIEADLFPPASSGRAGLIVCNPPWLPGKPGSPMEHAIYDQESRMLKGFLAGLAERLTSGGEGWLILSDFAEHLGLRTRIDLLAWIEAAGLVVLGRHDAKPTHPKAGDSGDALYEARSKELTSLWRLGVRPESAAAASA